MCGIVYNYNFDGTSASRRVLKQFRRQVHRGTTSFGFALPDKHVMDWKIKYNDIARALKRTVNPEILFHHRLSTSTADRITACHPFSTKDVFKTEFVGVHNGMLANEHALYEVHKQRFPGLRYVSDNGRDFNDSEAYVYDLASYFSGLTDGIQMTGYGAFIVVEYDKKTHERLRLHWGTTNTASAPLRVHHTKNHLDITSEGKGWLVKQDVHYVYDYKTGDITTSDLVHKPLQPKYDPYAYTGGYGSGYSSGYHYSGSYDSWMPRRIDYDNLSPYEIEAIEEEREIIAELERRYPSNPDYTKDDGMWFNDDDDEPVYTSEKRTPVIPAHELREAVEQMVSQRA